MPVLDAKALDDDSKGMAFLLKVLRQNYVTDVSPKPPEDPTSSSQTTSEKPGRVHFHFRFVRRAKHLRPDML